MAYTIKQNGYHKEYICKNKDSVLNINLEGVHPGSTAIVPSEKKQYILDIDKNWIDMETHTKLSHLSFAELEIMNMNAVRFESITFHFQDSIYDFEMSVEKGELKKHLIPLGLDLTLEKKGKGSIRLYRKNFDFYVNTDDGHIWWYYSDEDEDYKEFTWLELLEDLHIDENNLSDYYLGIYQLV